MEKIQLDQDSEFKEKDLILDDLLNSKINENLVKLAKKIDILGEKLRIIENKIDKLDLFSEKREKDQSEVEIEEHLEIEEDYLTPPDLIFENEAIRNTGHRLISFRIATASEIANITKKERAVESFYLNDLWSRNKIRKLRIGRKVFFYIGRSKEILPFKNSQIKSEWRETLVSLIRAISSFDTDRTLKTRTILKYFVESYASDNSNDKLEPEVEKKLENSLIKTLLDIAGNTTFLKFEHGSEKIEFLVDEWFKLA
jgi:hypothetical protein